MVAKELRSGRAWRLWRGEFDATPPFPIGADSLFIAFYASAELGCFKVLGWPMPANVLDLFVEFSQFAQWTADAGRLRLLGALTYFSRDTIGAIEKEEMRALVLRGGPWSDEKREGEGTHVREVVRQGLATVCCPSPGSEQDSIRVQLDCQRLAISVA